MSVSFSLGRYLSDVLKKLNALFTNSIYSVLCGIVVGVTSTLTSELHDKDKCLGACSCGKMSEQFTFLLPMIISFLLYLSLCPGLLKNRTETWRHS